MRKSDVFIVGAKRTAFGTIGGALRNNTATDLAAIASRAALQSAKIDADKLDHIIFGNTMQTSKDAAYLPRHAGLRIGVPQHVPSVVVNRLCGSGFQAVINAAQQIIAGDSNVVLAGGTESMSSAPFVVRGVRFGVPLFNQIQFEDILTTTSYDEAAQVSMGITSENLAEKYNITRLESDKYSLQSQKRWKHAQNSGFFKNEIEPIVFNLKKGNVTFEVDEHPRDTTIEKLTSLPSAFKKNGIGSPGNSSGVCDGAAAVVVANNTSINKYNLSPLVRIVDWTIVGCDPKVMGIGPVQAIQKLCAKTGISLDKIDLIEINEAFAAQVLAVKKELNLEMDRLNVNGGAIAVGHPLGASGARILAHLSYELKRRGAKYGIGSACIGGGQGIAMLLETV